jgi:hypothetical protein
VRKAAIQKTMVTTYDQEEACWIATSPLLKGTALEAHVLGAAETEEEAVSLFNEMLEDAWRDYKKGRLAQQRTAGQPPKPNRTGLHVQVSISSKESLDGLAKTLEVSKGEVIDYLLALYHRTANQ